MKQDLQNDMKLVNVCVNLEKMFAIINNAGIKINVDVNVKNKLIKVYVIKDFCRILEIVSGNVIKCVMLVNIQIMNIVNAEKKLVDELVHECTESIEEVKLVRITYAENEISYKCSSCTMYIQRYFGYVLQ